MRTFRLAGLAAAFAGAFASAGFAGKLDNIYDDTELAELKLRYERGWRDNYDNVLSKVLTETERARLANVRFRFELRVPRHEPFGFLAGGNDVIASVASIKFLEDVALAYTWLDRTGLSTQSLADYLMMLRYWDARRGRPPKPLAALCVPDRSEIERGIVEHARRVFDVATVFVLLHEYGHVLYRHPGNAAVPPAVSRENEKAADAFALDVFTRLREAPIGVTMLFFGMSYLHENRADFGSDDEYRATLAARTHPVSPDRLQAFARNLTAQAQTYAKFFLRGEQMTVVALSLQVTQFAYLLGDPGVQRLSARIGETVRPADLAPRPKGRHLSAPCSSRPPSAHPFDGTLRGKFYAGRTDFDVDMVLEKSGDAVGGTFSYGAGYGRIEGLMAGDALAYLWSLGRDRGSGVIRLDGGTYRGTWGYGRSATDGGTFELTKSP